MILALCEPYHPSRHGHTQHSSPGVAGHFLLLETVGYSDWRDEGAKLAAGLPPPARAPHPWLRNYATAARSSRLSGLHIIRETELQGGESVAVIHTGAIRRLQKAWRRTRNGG